MTSHLGQTVGILEMRQSSNSWEFLRITMHYYGLDLLYFRSKPHLSATVAS